MRMLQDTVNKYYNKISNRYCQQNLTMAVESSQIRNRHNQNLPLIKLITSANRIWQSTGSEAEG